MLYVGNSTSASLSNPVTNYTHLLVTMTGGGGKGQVLVIPASLGDKPFTSVNPSGGTTWIAFGVINVGEQSVTITSQLNMPIAAYQFGAGENNIDHRILRVMGMRLY